MQTPVPGTIQAIWQQTLDGLLAAGHPRTAAWWKKTTPVERDLDTLTIAAHQAYVCQQLTQPHMQRQVSAALQRAVGTPLRVFYVLRAAPQGEDDPVIAEVLRRINAKNKGRRPPEDNSLDSSPQTR